MSEFEQFNSTETIPEENVTTAAEEAYFLKLRSDLLTLSEKGQIKHTERQIKKSNKSQLEKIMHDYKRKHTEEVNTQVTDTLISKLSDVLESYKLVDDSTQLQQELDKNQLLKTDLKNIISYATPYIPLIGLVCGVAIVGKHIFTRTSVKETTQPSEEEQHLD